MKSVLVVVLGLLATVANARSPINSRIEPIINGRVAPTPKTELKGNTFYHCIGGGKIRISSTKDSSFIGAEIYPDNSEDYYEGHITMKTATEGNVYHHEGDKVGTIKVYGTDQIMLNVDGKTSRCIRAGSGLE